MKTEKMKKIIGTMCVAIGLVLFGGGVAAAANNPPRTAYVPEGPMTGKTTVSYTYKTLAGDPDGDQVKYTFDWGDGTESTTGYVTSGTYASMSHAWADMPSGTSKVFSVRAMATDIYGAKSAWSAAIKVIINSPYVNYPPSDPVLSGPTNGVSGTPYKFTVMSTDQNGDMVKYLISWGDGSNTQTNLSPSGQFVDVYHSWNVSAGTTGDFYVLATVTDQYLKSSLHGSNMLIVPITGSAADTTNPAVSITEPANGTSYAGAQNVVTSATATDNVGVSKVEFYIDGILKFTDSTSSYIYVWNPADYTNGTHTLTAKAYDAAGNNTTSAAVSVTVNIAATDTTKPTVSITAPTSGASYTSAQTVTVSATASDNVGVKKVEFYDGTTLLGTDTSASYSYSWPITASNNGTHSLTARAYDAAGNNTVSTAVTVTVNISGGTDPGLAGYTYRKPVSITNANSALSDYQVQLNLDTASLITGGKMKSDCGDMRFSADGATQLSYWIESGCNTANTIVWVKIPSLASGNTTIYLYYGNPSMVSASNGNATFRLFDDFNDGSLNTSKWVKGNSSYARVTEASGYARISADKYNAKLSAYLSSAQKYTYPMKLVYSVRSQANNIHGIAGTGSTQSCSYDSCAMTANESQRNNTLYGNPTFAVGTAAVNTKLTTANTWSRNIMNLKSGSSSMNIGGTAFHNSAALTGTSDYLKFTIRKWFPAYDAVYDYDYVALGSSVTVEPTASVGAESQN
jgi:hypothetical protein